MPSSGPRSAGEGRLFDKTTVTLALIGFAALGLTALVVTATPGKLPLEFMQTANNVQTTAAAEQPRNSGAAVVWATSAPGRVEPKGGAIDVRPEASGRVTAAYAKAGDDVQAGDLLAVLRDDEILARLSQAHAEAAVRVGERNEEEEEKNVQVLERRQAADALAAAERALHDARMRRDTVFIDARAGRASKEDLDAARQAIATAEEDVATKTATLESARSKADTPPPTRLDSGLTLARADVRLAEIALENTRLRAPVAGTLLRFDVKAGETVAPTSAAPVAQIGDMSKIQITAEVPERDVNKVRAGQEVIVRSNAFDGQKFDGKVVDIAPTVGSPGLRAQGPRQQLDAEVLEVTIELDGNPSLMPGMRVDVFFKAEQRVSNAGTPKK